MFQNREEVGQQLAQKLEKYRGTDAVILALPRGGVVIGAKVAKALSLPLDIIVARKIGHPDNPEYAVCAVDENGILLCNEEERALLSASWLAQHANKEKEEAARRTKAYRAGKEPVEVEGKTGIVVDDGIATGLTMRLAVYVLKTQRPARVVVAVPVASPEAARTLKQETDELVLLLSPQEFSGAVGAHYREFPQVDDETVIQLLHPH